MDTGINFDSVIKYRAKLIEYGRRVAAENPDRLSSDELTALASKILEAINELDMSIGFENHDSVKKPVSVTNIRREELFINFIDWYDIIPTGTTLINSYVQNKYPQSKYKRVICVGDGEFCHLGRKLASKGYDVVVVDPVSKKEFAMPSNGKHGKLHIVNGQFFRTSRSMIEWADIVVGAKVPLCAEDLTKLDKPTVFTISNNPEIYKMRYNGVLITSDKQLRNEIEKSPKVKRVNFEDYFGQRTSIYVCDGRDKEDMDEYSM